MTLRRVIMAAAPALALVAATLPGAGRAVGPNVLLVGTYNGIPGQYASIQAAVNAAQPGDWVLVGPGDYHEKGTSDPDHIAGVLITTPNLHLRGMDRNNVVVDGTNAGGIVPCDSNPAVQDLGPLDSSSVAKGRNGVEVFKADGVSIENMTVCNFLSSAAGDNGNEVWWNGGDGTGTVGMNNFSGGYLTASVSYYKDDSSAQGKYGIFTSNERGPGVINHTYASNMGDSAYYIGACPDCNVDLTDAHAENSALGYSGTNGGGHLIIENSEWDNNKAGIVPNTLNNDDAPSPQDGYCPSGGTGPTGTHSCMIVRGNRVHDNNNPNTPQFGIAGAAPLGAGIELSGGRNDTVVGNTVYNQKGWGILINDFPDTGPPPAVANCNGGTAAGQACYFVAFGSEVTGNTLSNNGGFGNVTNGDLADDTDPSVAAADNASKPSPKDGNCFHDNADTSGTVSTEPPQLQTVMGTCGMADVLPVDPVLTAQVACASGLLAQCPSEPAANYPARGTVVLLPIPRNQVTMPNPCAGAPANAWCPAAVAAATQAPSSPIGLVNTGRTSVVAAGAGAAVVGLGLVVALGARRRRRAGG